MIRPRFVLALFVLLHLLLQTSATPTFLDTILRLGDKNYTANTPSALVFVPSDPDLLLIATAAGSVSLVRIARLETYYSITEELDTASLDSDRSILGIGSDPFEPTTFYVSSSILVWKEKGIGMDGWQNGRIERLIFDEVHETIRFEEQPAVSGLPVSPTVLGVNGAVVDPFTGRLLVGIGSFSNGGVSTKGEGNVPDSVASGSILEVDIRRGGTFRLEWSSSDPVSAIPLKTPAESGIRIYAEGFRSPFQPTLSRFNELYVIDGGPSKDRGERSVSCKRSRPFRKSFPDKIISIRRGEFYGHPNRQREGQCAFVSSRLKPSVAKKRFPNYTPPLFTNEEAIKRGDVGSGTVGATFYDSNLFPEFRGTLLGGDDPIVQSTDFGNRKSVGLNAFSLEKKTSVRVGDTPGISLAVNIRGDVFAAQATLNTVGVAIPRLDDSYKTKEGILSVFPSRGLPGSFLFIVGVGIPLPPAVKIGGERCSKAMRMPCGKSMIRCVVPSFSSYPCEPLTVTIGKFSIDTAFTVLDPALSKPSFAGPATAEAAPVMSPEE